MYNFRVAECLIEGKLVECVFIDGGKQLAVHKTSDGHKYFCVDNYIDKSIDLYSKTFINRIGDAVQVVKDGNGDVISVYRSCFGGECISVWYFIDREYGEEMRNKTIEGWKDASFGYAVKFENKNSISGGYFIDKNLSALLPGQVTKENLLLFNTKDDVICFRTEIVPKVYQYAKEAMNTYLERDKEENIFDILGDIILKEYNVTSNIIVDMAADFWKEDLTGMKEVENKYVMENYCLTPVQYPV